MKIPDLFHRTAGNFPKAPAIIDEYGSLSYHQLSVAIRHAAAKLQGHGILPGMGVGVLGANSRHFIIWAYAVMECDAVLLPLSNQLSDTERLDIIHTTGLHAIMDDHRASAPFENVPGKELDILESKWRLSFNPVVKFSHPFAHQVKDAAFIRFTSGTTGNSKGVVLSHETIYRRITAANQALQLGPGDRVLWVLSMAYHFVVSIILYLHHGAGIILCNDFLAAGMMDLITKHQATFLYLSPMHIRMLSGIPGEGQMKSVRQVISTSTAITREQCDLFFHRFHIPVLQAYGIIEIGLPVINMEMSKEFPDAIGHAVPGYTVAILDDQFREVATGITGNLAIKGPGMLDAYLFPCRMQSEILQQGWFMTGDLASKNNDGLIKVEGRKKSMINVAGNKVFPEDVEKILNEHPSIHLSRVSGYQHPLLGESVQADVVLHPGKEIPDVEILRNFCREHLSPHKVPQKFNFVDTLPMTDSGKLKR